MVSDSMGKCFDPDVCLTVPETKVVSDSVEKVSTLIRCAFDYARCITEGVL